MTLLPTLFRREGAPAHLIRQLVVGAASNSVLTVSSSRRVLSVSTGLLPSMVAAAPLVPPAYFIHDTCSTPLTASRTTGGGRDNFTGGREKHDVSARICRLPNGGLHNGTHRPSDDQFFYQVKLRVLPEPFEFHASQICEGEHHNKVTHDVNFWPLEKAEPVAKAESVSQPAAGEHLWTINPSHSRRTTMLDCPMVQQASLFPVAVFPQLFFPRPDVTRVLRTGKPERTSADDAADKHDVRAGVTASNSRSDCAVALQSRAAAASSPLPLETLLEHPAAVWCNPQQTRRKQQYASIIGKQGLSKKQCGIFWDYYKRKCKKRRSTKKFI